MSAFTLTDAQQETLRRQVFDAHQPGPILHDFQALLDYLAPAGAPAAGKYQLLPVKSLTELDGRLAKPLRLALTPRQVRAHPYLLGLQLLGRTTGLVGVDGTGDKARLALDAGRMEGWAGLNPAERYFALLEAWLVLSSGEAVGQSGSWGPLVERLRLGIAVARAQEDRSLDVGRLVWGLLTLPEPYQLALLDLFGLIRVQQSPPDATPASPLPEELTPFGEALFALLATGSQGADDEDEEAAGFGAFRELVQPYIPAYQHSLALPEPEEGPQGVYVYKASLGKVWRRVALEHDDTLHDLIAVILDAFDFDFDHLYEFSYRDRLGRTVQVGHPESDDELVGTEVTLNTVPLRPGQSMKLLYDFGDNWEFDVKLERTDPPGSVKKLPRVLEQHGKAPEQYPDWD